MAIANEIGRLARGEVSTFVPTGRIGSPSRLPRRGTRRRSDAFLLEEPTLEAMPLTLLAGKSDFGWPSVVDVVVVEGFS